MLLDDPKPNRCRTVPRPLESLVVRWIPAAALCLGLAACEAPEDRAPPAGEEAARTPQEGGTAVLCIPSRPQSLNPLVTPDQRASDLAPLLFTPLVRYQSGGEIAPLLARSWRWEDERTRLALELREDLVWHDGAPVTAEDVVWTLEVASSPEYGYPEAPDFSSLQQVEARDSTTVVLRFTDPFAAGLEPFAAVPILPRHLLGDVSPESFARDAYHREPIGSGPFRHSGQRPDGTLVFKRFEGYPEELGPVRLDRIAVRVIPETGSMVASFRVGDIDACVTTAGAAHQLEGVEDLELLPIRPGFVQTLILDTSAPPFDDPRVRRALSAALERSEIAATVSPLATPAGTPLPGNSPWIVPELAQPDGDPGLADSLLTAAGWTREGEGDLRRSEEGDELSFTLVAPPDLEDALTVVQADLRAAGVAVELRFMEWAAYVETIRNPETRPQAMALGFQLQSLRRPDLRGMLHSEGTSNLSGYSSARVDSLLDVAGSATEDASLRSAYEAIQREVAEDVPMIFTVHAPRVLAVGPGLNGVTLTPNTALATVAEWWKSEE